MNFPAGALDVLRRLEAAGYEAWIVGGAVRDALIGQGGHDVDITTNARPEDIQRLFSDVRTLDVGKAFGTIRVVWKDDVYEVTTYRAERGYRDGRHPDEVSFSNRIEEDLMRRDFTMNAMAWHPTRGLFDLYHGREDLSHGVLRAVGEAQERIAEDALRMLRAVRFAARFSLALEPSLRDAIVRSHEQILRISAERIAEELERMWTGAHPECALDLLCTTGLWATLFPEMPVARLSPALLRAVPREAASSWAALGRSIAGETPSSEPFSLLWSMDDEGEAQREVQAAVLRRILKRLKLPTKRLNEAAVLLRQPDRPLPQTLAEAQRFAGRTAPYTEKIARFLEVEAQTQGSEEEQAQVASLRALLDIIEQEHLPTAVRDLAISGADVLACGVAQGRAVGTLLDALLDAVIAGRIDNTQEALTDALRQFAARVDAPRRERTEG